MGDKDNILLLLVIDDPARLLCKIPARELYMT